MSSPTRSASSQQNVSKHLGVLHQAGIVGRRKDGNRVVYEIADPSVFTLCEIVCGGLQQQVSELAQILESPSLRATCELICDAALVRVRRRSRSG